MEEGEGRGRGEEGVSTSRIKGASGLRIIFKTISGMRIDSNGLRIILPLTLIVGKKIWNLKNTMSPNSRRRSRSIWLILIKFGI